MTRIREEEVGNLTSDLDSAYPISNKGNQIVDVPMQIKPLWLFTVQAQNVLYFYFLLCNAFAGTHCVYPWRDGQAE